MSCRPGKGGRGCLAGVAGALALVAQVTASEGKSMESEAELAVTPAFAAALADARSADPAIHARLVAQLGRRQSLAELDSPADLAEAGRRGLHADRVVDALAQNPSPSARAAFLSVLDSRVYVSEDARVDGLIRASVHLRPAPPALVRFWNRCSRPGDGFTPLTMASLVGNGSPPALKLFERKLLDTSHDVNAKTGWLRSSVPNHRNDPGLLGTCERLLRSTLPLRLRAELVDLLFDDRVPAWLLPALARSYSPPPLESASRPALVELVAVGDLALAKVKLREEQRAIVKAKVAKAKALLGS